jgi:hypothetical protein
MAWPPTRLDLATPPIPPLAPPARWPAYHLQGLVSHPCLSPLRSPLLGSCEPKRVGLRVTSEGSWYVRVGLLFSERFHKSASPPAPRGRQTGSASLHQQLPRSTWASPLSPRSLFASPGMNGSLTLWPTPRAEKARTALSRSSMVRSQELGSNTARSDPNPGQYSGGSMGAGAR